MSNYDGVTHTHTHTHTHISSSHSQLGAIFSSREQKLYASAGAVAEEVLSIVQTIFMFGGEHRESQR